MKNLVHIADTLKAAFIDFVLANFDDTVVIGHEVMYGSLGKFADIILLYKGDTYAIEIKSDADSLARIDDQVNEYQKQFNYVMVVCGKKYRKKLSEKLPKSVGLYMVNGDANVKEIRKATRKTRLDKIEMLFSINTAYLSKMADFPTSRIGSDAIRTKYTKKRISCIQEILYNYWVSRLKPGFDCFLSDRGSQTIPADLSNFSSYFVQQAF
jgi:hypothetical protein